MSFSEVYSIASAFIVSCPSTNPTLPVKAFPAVTFSGQTPTPGKALKFDSAASSWKNAVFFSGLNTTSVAIENGKVVIPDSLRPMGTAYLVITSDDNAPTDNNTVAGPAILQFDFNSNGDPISA